MGWDINGNNLAGRWLMTLLGLTILVTGCEDFEPFVSDDHTVTREIQLKPYSSIWTYGLFDICLVQDTTHKVILTGRKAVLNNMDHSQDNHRITFREGSGNHWYSKGGKPTLEFHFRNLRYLRIEEPANLISQDTIHTDKLQLFIANELSEVNLLIDAGYFYLENWTTSTGIFTIDGKCREMSIRLCGSGHLEAAGLQAQKATILQQSIGDAHVRVHDTLEVQTTSSGNVYYYGRPEKIIFDQHASGELIGN